MSLPGRPFEVARYTVAVFLMWAPALAAQSVPAPPGEIHLAVGAVSLYPSIVLRDVGFDSNILNETNDPKGDFTFTTQPRLRAVLPLGSTQLTGSATVGFVYYATYKSQQSINRLFEGRFEGTTSRLRPFVAGSLNHARERAGYEIDARVLRRETAVSAGAELKLTGITSLVGSYQHTSHEYGDGSQPLETILAAQLDYASDIATTGARFAVTPLTTVSLDLGWQRDRFENSTIRDADSVRVLPGVEFAPDAVISGHASAGFRWFDPRDPRLKEFRGFVGSANVVYTLLDTTRFTVEATRDVMYSFDPLTPYFIVGAVRLTVSQRVGGPLDVIGTAGHERLEYQSLERSLTDGPIDRTRMVGGGLGFRLGPSLRLTLIYDFTERTSSDRDRRAYQRRRLFASATFGV